MSIELVLQQLLELSPFLVLAVFIWSFFTRQKSTGQVLFYFTLTLTAFVAVVLLLEITCVGNVIYGYESCKFIPDSALGTVQGVFLIVPAILLLSFPFVVLYAAILEIRYARRMRQQ